MRWALMTALMVAVVAARGAAPAAAQVTAEAAATLSADTIGLGDVFQLFVTVEVSPGSAVYFPDSVATAFAPFSQNSKRERSPSGSGHAQLGQSKPPF